MSEKKWLSRKEICCAIAGISLSTLYRRIKDGTIPASYIVKIGNRVAFSNKLLVDLPYLLNGKLQQEEDINDAK